VDTVVSRGRVLFEVWGAAVIQPSRDAFGVVEAFDVVEERAAELGPVLRRRGLGRRDLAGLSAGQRVLDADCGNGACLRALAADLIGFSDVA
jgi:hypothetical protein